MSMVHMSSLFIVSAFALIVGLLIIAQAAAENPRCRSEYTWISGGNEYGYEALNEDLCGSSSTCGGKYPKPDGLEDRPPPVEDDTVELDFFGIILDPTKNSTCLGITYTLNRYGASKVKGIQFLLDGLGYNSHNRPCCQVLNYTVELNYEAVVTNPSTGEPRKFSFDCFCDLWPLEPYTLTIRTLPVDFENQTLLDPSSIVRDFRVPGCSPTLEWDQYCQKSKEELWKPQLLVPEQLFPQYLELKVTFNIAPPDYRFIEYVISVLEIDVPKPMQYQVVETSSLISTPVMVNGLMMNVSSVIFTLEEGDIGKTVHTSMFPKCHSRENDCSTPTHVDETHLVEIIANPCDLDPCGELGSCEPHERLYKCLCNEGAILDRHPTLDGDTCIDNPCNSDPCGPLGTCGPEGAQYYCNCTSTALYDGETCIPDPCNVPNTCDKYSTCRLDDDFNSECFCADGITCIVDECKKESSPCITMATCGESSLDIVEGWKHHDCNCGNEAINSTMSEISVQMVERVMLAGVMSMSIATTSICQGEFDTTAPVFLATPSMRKGNVKRIRQCIWW
ncbi:uncharacterized protein LOC100890352 isoform X1 [Strongylocentrotus purpuratus]|uniref:EGF-like domain-containing protein n=1 Tax=Strongylocentrotus purpuratus TaxID=7668 RepID=A0A7M7MY84_STRPU|nr:uncharacterized protein LOC100890352 isoform X1 [Strongylocentrotus purpuratus]